MAWHSTTETWAGGDERTTVMRVPKAARRPRRWPTWVLPLLAFVCGAFVSAAVFTIGWRHQTQQNAAAQSALADATARNHKLSDSLATAREKAARAARIATQARASARASVQAAQASGATIAAEANAAQADATSVSGSATSMASAAGKVATELRTLTTYLTTTPSQQLDAGYIDSQTAYLARQVAALQSAGGTTSSAAARFDAAIRKLGRLASALSAQR